MRNLKFITFIFVTMALSPFLQSCLDDDSQPSDSLVISTINIENPDSKDFYFTLDNGQKMFPSDTRWLENYKLINGQRAFVIFKELEETVAGYDYNIQIKEIRNILTKDIVTMGQGESTEENIGDNKINATYMWINQDKKYLTIEYQYYGTHSEDKKHFLNLVVNDATPAPTADDANPNEYVNLEFRHNEKGDSSEKLEEGYASFKLDNIKDRLEEKKGIRVRVNTLYTGIKTYEVKFP